VFRGAHEPFDFGEAKAAGQTTSNSLEEVTMPFKSEAQRRYFEANKAKLEKQGVDVKEWEQSSKGLKLPERAPRPKSKKTR
jgi:predicted phage gp36 major capsid-like protein